jgi:hypothetical protein
MWQLLAQLNGTKSQRREANSGYILDLFCSLQFAPNNWLTQLIGDPINLNPLYYIHTEPYLAVTMGNVGEPFVRVL